MTKGGHLEQRTEESRDDYTTPPEVVAVLREYGDIVLDPCSNADSVVGARRELYEANDGLTADWNAIVREEVRLANERDAPLVRPFVFVNPPYSNTIAWVAKICEEHRRGVDTILLMPARTETELFHEEIAPSSAVISFRKKRIHFYIDGVRTTRPTHPSMFPAWIADRHIDHFVEVFDRYGCTFKIAGVPF